MTLFLFKKKNVKKEHTPICNEKRNEQKKKNRVSVTDPYEKYKEKYESYYCDILYSYYQIV